MIELKKYINIKKDTIDHELVAILTAAVRSGTIQEAMRYSLMAGGKRLRPILCLASAEAVGGNSADVLKVACALEMIHTYSLVHDDLPAMDNDDLRRGKPTCHVAFDESTAILVGDGLLTMAFEVLSGEMTGKQHSPEKQIEIIHKIACAAGHKGMIEGQMRDIASEGIRLSLEALEAMHLLKTGALIEASIHTGATLGGGTAEQIQQLCAYGRLIGLAFQVKDDILNVEGDPALMGKAVGTDQERHKTTYPSIMGLDAAKVFSEELITNALHIIDNFDSRSDPLRAIARYILERKR
jgi:geranylgeranyl diphosphate synthase, type II